MRYFKIVLIVFMLVLAGRAGAVSTLVADTKSGFIIESENALTQRPPASLTKLMTLYLTFGALENGILKMDDELSISKHAASQPKSKLYVKAGETISVHDAIMALIVKSANDVAVVVAEALAPSETEFAEMMTRTARALGLNQTVFKNASGLHEEGQVTTARDMAILTMALIEHYPQYYDLFSKTSFSYKGETYASHNTVLQEYEGAEGLKTGFVSAVGYNVISTAKRGKTRLVGIVIGDESPLRRDLRVMRLLDKGFNQVSVQKRAERDGRLQSAFNPLNRQAFIADKPTQVFLPIIKTSVKQNNTRIQIARETQVAMAHPAPIPLMKPDLDIAQGDGWSIQVGAFEGQKKAQLTAQKAVQILGCTDKQIQTPQASNQFYRSRICGFSDKESAKQACRLLQDKQWQCFTVSP